MLEHLNIKNIALIDEANINFENGLNILSGETGAGKSMIIDSINIVLGEKAGKDIIRTGEDLAQVSAMFSINDEFVCNSIRKLGIEIEDDRCVLISRTINKTGKTSAKINGNAVTVGMLKQVSQALIDVHGQHEHQSLLSPQKHIELLDKFCGNELDIQKNNMLAHYKQYRSIDKDIQAISGDAKERAQKIDLYKYQIEEIESAELKPNEEQYLEEQQKILSSTEKLTENITETLVMLSGSDIEITASDMISKSASLISDACSIDNSLTESSEILEDISVQLEEVIYTIRNYLNGLDHDPRALDRIEMRLDLIYNLKRKYGGTITDILDYYEKIKEKLEFINNSEEELNKLANQKKELKYKIKETCINITEIRKQYAQNIEKQIENTLNELGMKNAKFKINIEQKKGFTASGWDNIEFLISPNPGEELKPLAKIASGGEMSRVMLALKTVLADKDTIETFIFDEIDTGVSGRTAQQVAEKMALIGKNHQILCITHLPQIASMADSHFLIEKKADETSTTTSVIKLNTENTIKEIARLIGGAKITDSTISAAKEMKEMADVIKKGGQ